MRTSIALLALSLGLAASASAADYALEGTDRTRSAVVGRLTLVPRGERQVDVDLRLDDRRFTGTLDAAGGRVEGVLLGGAGLSGLGEVGVCVPFAATYDATRVQGTCGATAFTGVRPLAPDAAGYDAQPAVAKQAALLSLAGARPYAALPALGSRGVGEHLWDTLNALRRKVLERTFSTPSDVRPPRTKLFHPFGSVATVVYEPIDGHPFTGLFATGGEGLARLSLATDADAYVPGIALKLFVQGEPSVNVHAIPSFEPQASRDFFERAPSNEIPPPTALAIKLFSKLAQKVADPLRRPVDHVAAVLPDGTPVAAPVAPRRIHFRPAEVHFPADAEADFRALLATIPPGTVIYTVHAETDQGEVAIGRVRTRSTFVASDWGDRVLHFEHAR